MSDIKPTPSRLPRSKMAPSLADLMANASKETLSVAKRSADIELAATDNPRSLPNSTFTLDVLVVLRPLRDNPQGGVDASRKQIIQAINEAFPDLVVRNTEFYLQLQGTQEQVIAISEMDGVEMVWPNQDVSRHLLVSAETVRASAGWRTFEARGKGITWAVLDTGIDASHPQFQPAKDGATPRKPTVNASLSTSCVGGNALEDPNGHGTHVAGIIAGAIPADYTESLYVDLEGVTSGPIPLEARPSGLAPAAQLISVQVLRPNGSGKVFECIQGLEYIRNLNQSSRELCVDGANLSFGYDLEAITHGCGFSPICEEVNRAVQAGICVVVSCGNAGYGLASAQALASSTPTHVGLAVSISDPANADLCIAVGSVHKSAPHKYGVSYFSSKGPTLDGRKKPDLVAPGERIYSCKAGYTQKAAAATANSAAPSGSDGAPVDSTSPFDTPADAPLAAYVEMSGTSMAAPHVSGAIASFLSVRPDFRGKPQEIKEIFKASALDLRRDPGYQGCGLVDVFKALTSV